MNRARRLTCAAAAILSLGAALALAQTADKPASTAASIDTLKRIHDSGAILIGVREASVPFSFLDANKQPQGYSVDICIRIADAIKTQLKMPRLDTTFVPVSSSNRISLLVDGKIDLECGSTTNTRERQQQVAFAYTTFVAGIKMLAKKKFEHQATWRRTCAARRSS